MKAEVDWLIGVIRSGKHFEKHGDPYDFICTIMREDEKAFLMAASGFFSKETYKAIEELCKRIGVTSVRWDKKNNKPRTKKQIVKN